MRFSVRFRLRSVFTVFTKITGDWRRREKYSAADTDGIRVFPAPWGTHLGLQLPGFASINSRDFIVIEKSLFITGKRKKT